MGLENEDLIIEAESQHVNSIRHVSLFTCIKCIIVI